MDSGQPENDLAAAVFLQPGVAFAYDWYVTAKVKRIEGTYSPSLIQFIIDRNAGGCTAGNWLRWYPKGGDAASQAQSLQTITAMLLTAQSTAQAVEVYENDNNGQCTVDFMHIIAN